MALKESYCRVFCRQRTSTTFVFQKMAAPGGEAMQRSPGTPNGDVIEHSDDEKDRQEYLEVNFKYPLMLRDIVPVYYRKSLS